VTKSLARAALLGAVSSIAASKMKALSERRLQLAAETLWPPTEQQKQLVGADPTGHLENMPPAVLADRVAKRLSHEPLDRASKLRIQNAIHYTFGALSGGLYGALAECFPSAAAGAGTAAGAALYLASHGSALPLLGIQAPPWRLPRAAFVWEFTSHLVFGAALELGRQGMRRFLPARS
jgi:uncharacterized membrane protein YagU involved in acid resistance